MHNLDTQCRTRKLVRKTLAAALPAALFISLSATPGYAYIGPGAGLSAFGALAALVAVVVVSIVGFVWFPVKRLMRRRHKSAAAHPANAQDPGTS